MSIKNRSQSPVKRMSTSPKKIKKKKNVDYQSTEFIIALLLLDPDLTLDKIKKKEFPIDNLEITGNSLLKQKENFYRYKNSVLEERPEFIKKYIKKFKEYSNVITDDIYKVYLTGKICSVKKINDLNKEQDLSKCKSDIYIETSTGDIIGISIKKTIDATKTNLSLEKLLELVDIDSKKELKELRQNLIKEEGYNSSNYPRLLINKKLQGPNPYYNKCEKVIEIFNNFFIEQIVNRLYLKNFLYKIYEFDGNNLDEITGLKININECTLNKYNYETKSGKPRKAAKLFYLLTIKNENIIKHIRVEIRFKGNIWGSSAQFLCHIEN